MTYDVPAGWHVASRSLTPHLVNPREVFTAGTGALVARDGLCAQMPSASLAAMKPSDVLVTLQERFGNQQGFPPRPRRFGLVGQHSEAETCAGPRPAFRSHWSAFRAEGRAFHLLVAVGVDASRARVREALRLLDSMRIAPRWHTRTSSVHSEPCLHQRAIWAATVPFTNGPFDLPPHAMIAALPRNGVILAILRWRECKRLRGMPRLRLPLRLDHATRMQFPGPRGDELPLYRVLGRLPDGSYADLWAFLEPGQRAAAQRRLSQLPLGDDPGLQGLGHQP